MKFYQFCSMKDNAEEDLGKNKGDLIFFDKVSNIATQGGTLVETNTMPESQFTVRTGTLQVTEYGNSLPYTGKLETLAEFSIDNLTSRVARDDQAKVLDSAAGYQFKLTQLKYACLTASSAGSFQTLTADATQGTTTCAVSPDMYHIRACVDKLKTLNVPKIGNDYVCIASVNALRGIMNHADWVNAALYSGVKQIFEGEVGRIEGVRFIEETNVLSNARGSGTMGEAIMFGADVVMKAVALLPEMRRKIATDYGRSKGVAWYGILGFCNIWDYTNDSEIHSIHINSV